MSTAAYRAANKAKIAEYNKRYAEANKERLTAYRAARKDEVAAYHKTYYAKNKDAMAAYQKAYHEAHPHAAYEFAKRMRARYPDRYKARKKVNREVEAGRWPPASMQVCEICGEAQAQQYHHHLGYKQEHWLHTQAVCKECHRAAHKEINDGQ